MIKPTVYLAGPIAGTTYEESTEWRNEAIRKLGERNIDALSPMRGKEMLGARVISHDSREYTSFGPFYRAEGIMMRDHADCHRADALLVYLLGSKGPSFGTAMELAWAYHARKPTVVVIEDDNPHWQHPMLSEAILGLTTDNLQEGIDMVATVLGR